MPHPWVQGQPIVVSNLPTVAGIAKDQKDRVPTKRGPGLGARIGYVRVFRRPF